MNHLCVQCDEIDFYSERWPTKLIRDITDCGLDKYDNSKKKKIIIIIIIINFFLKKYDNS